MTYGSSVYGSGAYASPEGSSGDVYFITAATEGYSADVYFTTAAPAGGPVTVYSAYTNTATATTPVATAYSPYSNTASATTPVLQAGVPAAPTGLTATPVSETRIDLAWTDAAVDETGYAVERATGVGGAFFQIASLSAGATAFLSTGLAGGTLYRFRVRAFNATGTSAYANEAQATTAAAIAPAAPTGAFAASVAVGAVRLQWNDNAGNELAYEVERATVGPGGPFARVLLLGPDATTAVDPTVAPATAYWYRVRATNASGASAYSGTVAVLIPAAPDPGPILEAASAVRLSVLVDWDNDGDFEDALEDVSGDVLLSAPMQSVRGRDQVRALAPPMAGSATATVDNEARTYSPQNTGGPLYGQLLPGRRVRHTAERPGTTPDYAPTVLADGPLAYWRLGEASGTAAADASGNGRTATYATVGAGLPTRNQPGALRSADADAAVLFDGVDDYVSVADVAAYNTNTVTVECWLWLDGQPTSQNAALVNRRRADNVGGYTLELGAVVVGGATAIRWFCYTTAWQVVEGPALAHRRWYHVVGTYDASTLRLYYDGEPVATATPAAGGALAQTGPFQFQLAHNIEQTAAAGFLKGRLDEVAVYGAVLPADRIRAHHTAGTAGLVSLFTGNLDDVPQQPAFGQHTATLPALGSLARLRGVDVSTGLYQDLTTGQALGVLLDAAGWPAADRRIEAGNTVLRWWWLDERDAFAAAVELANTEGPGALLGEDGDGNVVFEGRYHRLTAARSLLPQAVFLEGAAAPWRLDRLDYSPNLKGVINACAVEARTRTNTAPEVLWQLGAAVSLGAHESRPFKVAAADGAPLLNVLTPAAGTDYTVVAGTLASLTLSRTSGGNVTLFLTAGPSGVTLSGLQLRGQRLALATTVRVGNRVDTSVSRGRYGERSYALAVWGDIDPLVAQDFCDAVVNAWQEPRASFSVWLPADVGGYTADRALFLRPSDRLAVQDFQTGLNGEAFVEQVEYTNQGTEFLVRLGCEETSSAATNYLIWGSGAWGTERWGY